MRSFSYNTLRVGHTTYKHNLLAKRWVRCCVMLLSGGKELQQFSFEGSPWPLWVNVLEGGVVAPTSQLGRGNVGGSPPEPLSSSVNSAFGVPENVKVKLLQAENDPSKRQWVAATQFHIWGEKKDIPLFAPLEFVGDKTAETYISLLQCFSKETFSKLL